MNTCRSCHDPHAFTVGSVEACAFLCPERVTNFAGSGSETNQINCALAQCPSAYPFQSRFGSCYASQEEADNDFGDTDIVFDKSPEVEELAEITATNGKCPENYAVIDSRTCYKQGQAPLHAQDGKCPDEDYQLSGAIKCKPCDDSDDWHVPQQICESCPRRVYKTYQNWGVTLCERPCPQANHFKRWDGKCLPCDTPQAVAVETHCNLENDCNEICPNRTIIKWVGGNVSSVISCPADKPMMDDAGVCYACDAPVPIGVQWNPDFCSRFCPTERHLDSTYCVLNT